MKKFSWIFALILALSIGFIGCPAGSDDDDDTTTQQQQQGGYSRNPDATDFTVSFSSTGDGSITSGVASAQIKKNGDNNGAINPGTVTYIAGSGGVGNGYQYEYGTAGEVKYGNVILRFNIDLGDFVLADYGKITFDWQATAPIYKDTDTVNSGKNLFLYATDDEDAITPWNEPKETVVSTNLYEEKPAANYYSTDANPWTNAAYKVPSVEGLEVHHVEMPILANDKTKYLSNAWLAIYVHAGGGTYKITNLKFWAGDQDVPLTGGGAAAPAKPLDTATPDAEAVKYTVTLDDTNTAGKGTASNQTAATITANSEDGGYDVAFTDNNQWLVVTLPTTVVNALKASKGTNPSADFWVQINGTFTEGKNSNYRFYLGDATYQNNWNASAFGSNEYPFDGANPDDGKDWGIAGRILQQSYDGNTTNDPGHPLGSTNPSHFILRYTGGANASKVNIVSIDLYILPVPIDAFDVPIPTEDGAVGAIKGVISGVTATGYTLTYDAGAQYGPASYFKVKLPDGTKLGDYKKMDIILTAVSGDTANKRVLLNITDKDTVPTDVDVKSWADPTGGVYPDGPIARITANNGSDTTVTRTFDFSSAGNTNSTTYNNTIKDLTEMYFIIYIWSGEAAFTFSGFKLY